MVKEKYKAITYTKTEDILVSEKRYCDICGREITGAFWWTETGHYDEGTRFKDSFVQKDACGLDCLQVIINAYCDVSGKDEDKVDTRFIDIEHKPTNEVEGEIIND